MDLRLGGKAALVTGGSRGIGRAIAEALLREGASVAICARNPEALAQTVGALERIGPPMLAKVADVTDAGAVAAFVDSAAARSDGSTCWSTTPARTARPRRRYDRESAAATARRQAVRLLRHDPPRPARHARRKDGRIVNVIGQAVRHPHPDRLPSGITNVAAQAMTKAVADAVARDNVRVNSVCPQYIATELVAAADRRGDEEARRRPGHGGGRLHARQRAGPHGRIRGGGRPGGVPAVGPRQLRDAAARCRSTAAITATCSAEAKRAGNGPWT